ncbi:hypothetical protein FKM82_016527 [Ascaphus truei]
MKILQILVTATIFFKAKMNGMIDLVILLVGLISICMTNPQNALQELSPDTYFSTLLPGKTSLLYFSKDDSLSSIPFLEELQKSVEPLQDYGVCVAKVNCIKEDVPKYCAEENAYLFRGITLLREFPTDALFDVNAIVANVLFVLLYNEVKYVTSVLELQNIEDDLKGKEDVVFVYVRAVGIPEHRSVMETAYVYGSKYQFVLTTETTLLENISAEEPGFVSARLLFGHCKAVTNRTQKCRRTLLEQSLTTLNIHRFLKLMDAPLVADVSGDPEKVTSLHLQLGLPMVFILSQQETYKVDKTTAEHVAWQLLGKAGLAILLREKSDPAIPLDYNVALKSIEENMPVKYLMLEDTQEIIDLIENTKKEHSEDSEDKSGTSDQDAQDDEVAEAVYRDRKRVLPLEMVPSLTDESFQAVLTRTPHAVILFYASWEAVSLTLLQSFVDVAVKYKDLLNVSLARVNCADWPDLCSEQNITCSPAAVVYLMGKDPVLYSGMLGTEALLTFVMLSKVSCPLKVFSIEEAEEYLSGNLHETLLPYHNLSVLGIFTPTMKEAGEAFIGAGRRLRGFAVMGIYSGENASVLSNKYGTSLPALLFARHNDHKIYGISLPKTTAEDITRLIRSELLGPFPEITVENLPSFFTQQKPLLVLFSDGNLNHIDQRPILSLVRGKFLEKYAICWLNLKNTPVGNGILKRYFSLIPPLPLLVLINFDALGQVFAFPPDQHLTEVNILYWLEMLKAGAEQPA